MELSDSLSVSSDGAFPSLRQNPEIVCTAQLKTSSPKLATENARLKNQVAELQTRVSILNERSQEKEENLTREIENVRQENRAIMTRTIESERVIERKLMESSQSNSELLMANRQLSRQVSAFLGFLSSRVGREVETLDEAVNVYAKLAAAADSNVERVKYLDGKVQSLQDKLQEAEDALHEERKQRKDLERKFAKHIEESEEVREPGEDVGELKRKYQKKFSKMSEVIDSQKEEIDLLSQSLDRMKEISEIKVDDSASEISNMKQIYEAKIEAITKQMNSIEELIAQKDGIHEQLEIANREVNDECAELECQVADLKAQLEEKDQEIRNWQAVTKKWKEESEKTVSVAKMLETDVAEYQTTIHELQLKLSEAKGGQVIVESPKDDHKYEMLKNDNENLQRSIAALEGLLEEQAVEIAEAHRERGKLLTQVTKLSQYMGLSEQKIQELVVENERLARDNDHIKDDVESAQRKEYSEFFAVVNDLKLDVPEIAERLSGVESMTKADVLAECIAALLAQVDKAKAGGAEAKETETVQALKKKYAGVLMHLESAYKFLKNMGGSRAFETEEDKTALLTECARIGKFLEENDITIPDYSIFNPSDLNDPIKVARVFSDFVTNDQLHESPFWELYLLFMCLTQVNQILLGNIEANEAFVRDAQRITAQEKDERQMIKELDEWRARQIAVNSALLPVLQKCTRSEDEDFELLSSKFVDAYAKDEITWAERDVLRAEVEKLNESVEVLQTRLEERERELERDRKAFCKQTDCLVQDIENDIRRDAKEQARENAELRSIIADLREQLSKSKGGDDTSLRKAKKSIEKKKMEVRTLTDEAELMRTQTAELQSTLGQLTIDNCKLQEQIGEMEEQLSVSAGEIQRQKEKKRVYKSKLLEEENSNTEKLQQLMKRNNEVTEKYTNYVAKLEGENTELKDKVAKLSDDCSEFDVVKQQLRMEIAKLQVQNRTLNLKLNSVAQSLEREREANAAKQTAIQAMVKAQYEEKMENHSKTITSCKNVLMKILTKEFRATVSDGSVEQLIDTVYSELDRRGSEQFIISDARNLRKILKLDDSSSVVDVFRDVEKELASLQQRLDAMQDENKQLKEHDDFLKRENAKLEHVKTEMSAWTTWSRSMLHQLSSTANANMPVADIRYTLEEALLASIGHRTIRRKMEILRVEKTILTSDRIRTMPVIHDKVTSIRPIVLAMIFGKRLEEMNGSLPIRFGCLTKHDMAQPLRPTNIPVIPISRD